MCLMYDTTPMPESKLPPVYVRKEHKRLKMDPSGVLDYLGFNFKNKRMYLKALMGYLV